MQEDLLQDATKIGDIPKELTAMYPFYAVFFIEQDNAALLTHWKGEAGL